MSLREARQVVNTAKINFSFNRLNKSYLHSVTDLRVESVDHFDIYYWL